ncbi:MAG: TfoX/Sxy family protein [Fimbriimonadaceae bacterium]|nr:TfoX/Sxy family protein [Fimbriimonadaceae bacterium]
MIYRPTRYEQVMAAAEGNDVRARKMLDGMAVYSGEKMFAYLAGEDVGLKLAPEDQQAMLTIDGAEPLCPRPGAAPMKEYIRLPRQVLEDRTAFADWIQKSVDYAVGHRVH